MRRDALTLRARIIGLFSIALLIAGLIVLIALSGYYRYREKSEIRALESELSASLNGQIETLTMAYALPEQRAGIPLLLEQVKKSEALSTSKVLARWHSLPNYSHCRSHKKTFFCQSDDGGYLALITPIREGAKTYGLLFKEKAIPHSLVGDDALIISAITLLALFAAFLMLFYFLIKITSIEVPAYFDSVVGWLEKSLQSGASLPTPKFRFKELARLTEKIESVIGLHRAALSENERLQAKALRAEVSSQVAHDIASPLSALSVVMDTAESLPETQRILLRSSIRRITDIASNLRTLERSTLHAVDNDELTTELVSNVVDIIVSEKREEHRRRSGLKIESQIEKNAMGVFCRMRKVQILRALSNLMNNSIQAIDGDGAVIIRLTATEGSARITVSDTGKGVAEDILPKLGQRGATFGKADGSGLGIAQAKECVEKLGGTVSIRSKVGMGTDVELTIPRTEPPAWYIGEICVEPNSTIAVLDDDESIHRTWDSRFQSVKGKISIRHFSRSEELVRFVAEKPVGPTLYLIDYELIGEDTTGLDVIELCDLQGHAILVTSRFDDERILNRCLEKGIRLLPKWMASHLPVRLEDTAEANKVRYVLIDDDELTRLSWQASARTCNEALSVFETPTDFLRAKDSYSPDTPIYVDLHLVGEDGRKVCDRLASEGFFNLFLATGASTKGIVTSDRIRAVVNKRPPWRPDGPEVI